MDFDFGQLSVPKSGGAQTDPFKIFAALPRLEGAPNDLWRGQADALAEWHANRTKNDVLISLNTGAGKTLLGLLIARSFVNEGLDNVLYVCPTIDLVRQTAAQARSVGIDVTTRTEGEFDNDLFESGRTFCITNYAALFNGHSALRRKYFPQAIIFDDAHVAESMMRSAFTLSVTRERHQALFDAIAAIYRPHFRSLNREQLYSEALEQNRPVPQSVLVPPDAVLSTASQLSAVLRNGGASDDRSLTYAYEHLKDHFDRCAVVFRAGQVDITPPFLPSLALNIFEQRVRRVYLSATLHNKADIIRAFGREPDLLVEPRNDAGNGERLILFERELERGKFDGSFGQRLSLKHKVLVSIPGYFRAPQWAGLASPAKTESFSDELDRFRRAGRGSFILVSRVDGIDLPHETCRLMIIDGVPRGESLLEKYQFEYLHMRNFAASRIANRLVQLFGRINRGRSDYGAFLVADRDLNAWLNNDKNVALLPPLLRKQILLGRHVQEGFKLHELDRVDAFLDKVLLSKPRDAGWLTYYSQYLEAQEVEASKTVRAEEAERRNFAAARAEAIYAKHMWTGEFAAAREALDTVVADVARSDEKLAGWHNLWIGACLLHERDLNEAQFYFSRARGQLGSHLVVDTGPIGTPGTAGAPGGRLMGKIAQLTSLGRESYNKQFGRLERLLQTLDGGSPAQMEEAVRALGEALGFEATRPDNEFDTGPDVLWVDTEARLALGLELKTDKHEQSEYSKADVSQSLDHLSWIRDNTNGSEVLGVTLVGPDAGVSSQANPVSELYSIRPEVLRALRDRLLAGISDAYRQTSAQRYETITRTFGDGWSLSALRSQLCGKSLK
ncbi:MAG TPA: DEAD/DEAH box helicase family protein [Allosphingosinicella sp.]